MLGEAGLAARPAVGLDAALALLDNDLEPGDVLLTLTLGAGDVGTIADAFLRRLPRDRQAR
jgi:UDP-N-acetylmuramate--alanine ligase